MAKSNGGFLGFQQDTHLGESLGLKADSFGGLLRAIGKGFSFACLTRLQRHSKLPLAALAKVLRLPPRTLARRKGGGVLTSAESERLLRLARLFEQAVAVFEGDAAAAGRWMQEPVQGLGNRTPLDLAETEIGARAVEDLLGRLEYGVYS